MCQRRFDKPTNKNKGLDNQIVDFMIPKTMDGHFLLKNENKMLMASHSVFLSNLVFFRLVPGSVLMLCDPFEKTKISKFTNIF